MSKRQRLKTVENLMLSFVEEFDNEFIKTLYQRIPSGKKLRTKLILKIADKNDQSIKLASIIELIHMASLLHDDVIDEADTRRNVDSINAIFGNNRAIMLGDILYSKAFYELTSFDEKIAKVISNAVTSLSIGELLDVEFTESFNSDIDKYFDMIYKKTASLIEASAITSAILAGKDTEKFKTYGKNLGLAFQIIDDVLDIISDSKILGKPALNDFKEGKTTLPYIYLYNSLNTDDKLKLKSMFKKNLTKNELDWIKLNMQKTKSIEKSVKLAKKLGLEALDAIKDEKNPELEKVIKDMIEREF